MVYHSPDMALPLLPVAFGTTAAAFAANVAAQAGLWLGQTTPVTPGVDVLQYGSTGVLGLVTLGLGWAVIRGQLVSQKTADTADREKQLEVLLLESQKREAALAAALDRQLDWASEGKR